MRNPSPGAGFLATLEMTARVPASSPMPSIRLVEDETAIADTVLYALRAEGFEGRHGLTGQEALRAAGERVHDLAILDVGLPDIGGFALCRELRRERDLPVIFLTARDAEADRVLGLELGDDDYVVKPFSPRDRKSTRLNSSH